MRAKFPIIFTGIVVLISACKVDPEVKITVPVNDLTELVPSGWPEPKYNFSKNALTVDKFILGRALFYEPMLSVDNSVSCGSCHQRGAAFANSGHAVSHGILKDGEALLGTRNAPGLFNLNWHPYFMHDGGINHIEVQPLGPITNPVEMAETMPNVIAKLQASSKYKQLFNKAYGSETVNSTGMFKAMAIFMGTMYSNQSKYDHFKNGEADLNADQKKGYDLFLANCNACHAEPLFSDFKFRSNGLEKTIIDDVGREKISKDTSDRYKFKTPSLRNVEKTAPYMHDGRYSTLEDCLDHYTSRINIAMNPDPLLKNGLVLSADDKRCIIAFLKTLTDFEFINDKRFDEVK